MFTQRSGNKSQSKSLTEQLGKNCSNLPIKVRVTSCHETLQKYSISKGAVLDFYSIKTVKVAIARSSQGKFYSIPFDTQVKLSPLYNPENDLKKAFDGYHFTNILQLYRHGANYPRPVLVCALSGILGSSRLTSMERDDIYALEENGVSNDGQKALLCKDISYHSKLDNAKAFLMHSECDFTTDPQKLSLHPSVFFSFLKLPAELVMIDNSSNTRTVLTVTQFSSIDFIVAGIDQGNAYKKKIIQIYDYVNMEIQALEHCSSETKVLRFDADTAASQYQIRIMDERFVLDAIQLQFLDIASKPVEQLSKTTAVLCTPPVIRRNKPAHNPQFSTQLHKRSSCLVQSNLSKTVVSTPPVIRRKPLRGQFSTLPPQKRSSCLIQSNVDKQPIYEEIDQYNPWEGGVIRPHSAVARPIARPIPRTIRPALPLPPETTCLEENKKILEECSSKDVVNILDNLGMSQYRETFLSEQICGSLLMELTEDILLDELHIDRKLDRIKLLLIIKGKDRVTNHM